MAKKQPTFNECLDDMATILISMMENLGADTLNSEEIENFVNGCAVTQKLKQRMFEAADDE